jgi:hypothetical protein
MLDLPGLQTCPVCSNELRGHRYALLASIIENPKNQPRLHKFLNDIKSRSWSEVLRFSEWQGDSDVVQLYAIRCPTSLFALILIRSPFELYDDDHIIAIETLTADESSTLEAVIRGLNWKPLT